MMGGKLVAESVKQGNLPVNKPCNLTGFAVWEQESGM